jgi:hypothetical protein
VDDEERSYIATDSETVDARRRSGVVGWRERLVIAEPEDGMVCRSDGAAGLGPGEGSEYTEI